MPTAIRSANGLTIATLLILLSPGSVVAQSHDGLLSIAAVSTLSGTELRQWDVLVDRMIRSDQLLTVEALQSHGFVGLFRRSDAKRHRSSNSRSIEIETPDSGF